MSIRLLIVDDAETMLLYEKMLLVEEGYELDTAKNGIDALDKIMKRKPDVVLLDIIMPEMDGIECCRLIKSNKSFSDIKVIMVTTAGEYDKVKEAFDAGCDDYVTKPIDKADLLAKINELAKILRAKRLLKS